MDMNVSNLCVAEATADGGVDGDTLRTTSLLYEQRVVFHHTHTHTSTQPHKQQHPRQRIHTGTQHVTRYTVHVTRTLGGQLVVPRLSNII
jgi:hypothetical protein